MSRCEAVTKQGHRCRRGVNCPVHRDPCTICLESMTASTSRRLRCGHVFHNSCVENLKGSGSHACPLCRKLFDVSKYKISIQIENRDTDSSQSIDLSEEGIFNMLEGLSILPSAGLTSIDYDTDLLSDLESFLRDVGISPTDFDTFVLDAE